MWKFSWFLDSQEFLEISRKFSRNFTSRSRSRGIFNSLFTLNLNFETFSFHFSLSISISRHFHFTFHSRNEWTRFSFHFSLLEMSEPDFHFTFHFSNFQYPLSQGPVLQPSRRGAAAGGRLECFLLPWKQSPPSEPGVATPIGIFATTIGTVKSRLGWRIFLMICIKN